MKTTCLLLALCVGLMSGIAAADEIYVPANTPGVGSGNSWPWNTRSYTEWRYQLLFSPLQLQNKAGLITEIWFAPTTSGVHTATTFEMTMSHTSQNALSYTWAANLPNPVVVIPAAPHTWNPVQDAWTPVGMKNPFAYDGKSSLVVEIRYKGGAMSNGFGGSCHTDSKILRAWDNRAGAYTGTRALSANLTMGLITRLTLSVINIAGSGTPKPGNTIKLDLSSPTDPGLVYQVGTSLGAGPTPIGTRVLNLTVDALLDVSVRGLLPGIFQNYTGTLDAAGKAQAAINIPSDPRLVGIRLHSAFLTLDSKSPFGIKSISDKFSFTITT